jgi:lysophospholipid acyltransferase (LPLAT)-like uncharacterized protein
VKDKARYNYDSGEPLRFRLLVRWGPPAIHALLGLLWATCRISYKGAWGRIDPPSTRVPCIYVAWHRDMLMLSRACGNRGIAVVISQSRDGELAAHAARRMGYRVVRGSSSRGGIAALKELIIVLKEGHNIGVFADGPRGPAGQAKEGVIYLASKTGAPVVPLAAKANGSETGRSHSLCWSVDIAHRGTSSRHGRKGIRLEISRSI